jgi:hypothetical protein
MGVPCGARIGSMLENEAAKKHGRNSLSLFKEAALAGIDDGFFKSVTVVTLLKVDWEWEDVPVSIKKHD